MTNMVLVVLYKHSFINTDMRNIALRDIALGEIQR